MEEEYRIEKDFLGEKKIEKDAYYGIQTLRAKENFDITHTDMSLFPTFIKSLAKVKKACALTNFELGDLNDKQRDAIIQACNEIIDGKFHDQFIVDPIQGGAGTSTNMNANEVIANRALEILGEKRSTYDVIHPNNHINMSQSTNDVYPTAIKLTLHELIYKLKDSLRYLRDTFNEKAVEFKDVLKMGRTQLQDAVPMTLGQEFKTYAVMIDDDIFRLRETQALLKEVNLGATAIGTGINTKAAYQRKVISNLREVTGVDYVSAGDLIEATQDTGAFVHISGILKRVAIKISKICNDLRLLSSGPRAGFNEINLPKVQPGSSIMPGKVNPVIPEVVNQVAFEVIGSDVTISMACEGGQLQLNVFEPIVAYKLFTSINMMRRSFYTLGEKCIKGITANEEVCMDYILNSVTIVTSLNPILGYEKCSALAKEALATNRRVYDIVLEQELFTQDELDKLLHPKNMVNNY
ncbi:aspartate ammonia-lyase [Poseidonibacter ostreae]|jgi:aspartate ammonia-lyase|uniref:Aspartate ammonia-lyase n=1 Tax=Poseidonibacter ostreae TaxID=2654171 RepID=A0A6L4WQZ2_9BACT|nr:aspartate ammonia-lyase [Poseidonibacter ostreae]KAB7883103.1 aspartate ammonia-lyase [Poseidonibacter ostreae]KAB7887196.1 aspartate ammonia-lyase [Poseidonibacter ostreae]KAB7888129.1 aspartate ammonia-lyase [Poseidonibacter ostreae]MAC82950.1 aspartate ammonia-lyase [Arcobacter sp.]|tara:strand:+ start:4779 stop:6176 length:1398 start_codon:yes stop_codon:yes gene_type:complete